MDDRLRRCILMSIGALALVGMLLAVGVPGAVLLGFAPLAICLGLHSLMGHGASQGHGGPASTQHARRPHEVQANAADPGGSTR